MPVPCTSQCSDYLPDTLCVSVDLFMMRSLLSSTLTHYSDLVVGTVGTYPSDVLRTCFSPTFASSPAKVRMVELQVGDDATTSPLVVLFETGCDPSSWSAGPLEFGYTTVPFEGSIGCSAAEVAAEVSVASVSSAAESGEPLKIVTSGEAQCVTILSSSSFRFRDIGFRVDADSVQGGVFLSPPSPGIPPGATASPPPPEGSSSSFWTGTTGIAILSVLGLVGAGIVTSLVSYVSPEWGETLRDVVQTLLSVVKGDVGGGRGGGGGGTALPQQAATAPLQVPLAAAPIKTSTRPPAVVNPTPAATAKPSRGDIEEEVVFDPYRVSN